MGFISAKASGIASGGGSGTGGYLTASKLGDGDSYRIAILSPEPLEYWTVWGENGDQKKPFRFADEPTTQDILQELGDFTQRMNYEGTELEKPKFALSFFCFDYEDSKIKVFELGQKTLIKELDNISQQEDYEVIQDWDLVVSRKGLKMQTEYKILPAPRKKGMQQVIDDAWSEAQNKGYDLGQLMVGGNPFGETL